jgi:hypothetical protein
MQRRRMEMSFVRCQASVAHRTVRAAALTLFLFYLAWNALWIARGQLPPSILIWLAGIPSPTTGGYRSFHLLLEGRFRRSLLFNPFTAVYLALFAASLSQLLLQWVRRRRLAIGVWLARAWMAALAVGWVAKIVLGRQYW